MKYYGKANATALFSTYPPFFYSSISLVVFLENTHRDINELVYQGGFFNYMKKTFSLIMALVLLLGCIPFSASAAETRNNEMYCSACGAMGSYVTQWWEYGYYYNRLWQQLKCTNSSCGNVWNTVVMEVENSNRSMAEEVTP